MATTRLIGLFFSSKQYKKSLFKVPAATTLNKPVLLWAYILIVEL
jgi:hypothetical protein